jgi:alpha-amylase
MNNNRPSICFYFQVHQPYRLRDLRITELGHGDAQYFDAEKNYQVFRKVAEKCYLPSNRLMLKLLEQHPEFRIAYSLSGVFLDQCEEYGPDVLESFKALAATGKVEFLAETYYHSLSSLKSIQEFCAQVKMHMDKIEKLFGQKSTVFRNTELIFSNELAHTVKQMGFKGMIAEGADNLLYGRSPNVPYSPPEFMLSQPRYECIVHNRPHAEPAKDLKILLKNYRLSDDVAFRFSDRSWVGFPLNAETFTDWLLSSGGHSVNLFMDYETFGEHQWADTGIFSFLEALPAIWARRGVTCETPSQVIASWGDRPTDVYDAHNYVSWADTERDLSAWQGNAIQNSALSALFALEQPVRDAQDEKLLSDWRRLTTSDHFYYMCTKYWADGDVHKYFSPYDSPYEAYRRFSHALTDLRSRTAQAHERIKVKVEPEEAVAAAPAKHVRHPVIHFMRGIFDFLDVANSPTLESRHPKS